MDAPRKDPHSWRSIEGWLRSPLRLTLLLVALVALIASTRAYQVQELREAMGFEDLARRVFAFHAALWSTWAAASIAFVALATWLLRRTNAWAFLLVQLPLSVGVAWCAVQYQPILYDKVYDGARSRSGRYDVGPRSIADDFDDRRGGRRRGTDERPPAGEPDRRGRGGRPGRSGRPRPDPERFELLRLPREMALYWVILGIGAGLQSFLRTRSQERAATELELRTARLRGELAAAQVDSLRAQLHPHFLFNALHTVGGLVRAGEERQALETISGLGHLLRTTLDKGEAQEVTVTEELEVTESYLAIERIRFGDRLAVTIERDPAASAALLPAMLLLPLVENAVRYGVEPRAEGGSVLVRVVRVGERLVIDVSDDGPGFPDEVLYAIRDGALNGDPDERKHIGLANTRDRMRALYGDAQVFEIDSGDDGARVHIELPFSTGRRTEIRNDAE
ncbi:MAG: hypothetical protein GY711_01895 [bacterium]|nr:hypothetical protein [bacterium]